MIYIDIITDQNIGKNLKNQSLWLKENNITQVKHTGTKGRPNAKQFNRWRFENQEDALAFKLRWE